MMNWCSTCLLVLSLGAFVNSVQAAKIVGRGSDSTISLVKAIAAKYQETSGVTVELQGGGSSKGSAGALAGEVDFAFMSRGPKSEETQAGLRVVPYAIDGVAIVVHAENKTADISLDQLREIFSGNQVNWDDGTPIMALNRPESSGTREVFQEKVLGKTQPFGVNVAVQEPTAAIEMVRKSPQAIAFTSAGSAKSQTGVKILTVNSVVPTSETLLDGSYPITRTLHFAVKGTPSPEVKDFVNFALGAQGQSIIRSAGYVPKPLN